MLGQQDFDPAKAERLLTIAPNGYVEFVPAPVDLGTFPVEMAWHVRYRHDPAHRWLRSLSGDVAATLTASS